MASSYKYRGDLAETTLPEMLSTIDRFHVPGVIEATQGDIVKRVYVRRGYIIHASSTDRSDSLGAYLQEVGTVPDDKLKEVTKLREKSNKRLGELLLERGLLSPAQALKAIRKHLEGIVWSLFYWEDGEVTFGLGEFEADDMVQIQLPIRQVILEGIRQAPEAKRFLGRIGQRETVLETCYEPNELIETGMNHGDFQILREVDGKKTLYALCSLGPRSAADVAKMLYTFQVLNLIRRRGAPMPKAAKRPPAVAPKTESRPKAKGTGPLKVKIGGKPST